MKTTAKILSLLLLLAVVAFCFAACGPQQTETQAETKAETETESVTESLPESETNTETESKSTTESLPESSAESSTESSDESETEPTVVTGTVKIIIQNGRYPSGPDYYEYNLNLAEINGEPTVYNLFKAFSDTIYTEVEEGDYVFLKSIGNLNPDASNNEYIAIFTSDENFAWGEPAFRLNDIIEEYYELEPIYMYYASVGINDLVLKDGVVLAFHIEAY